MAELEAVIGGIFIAIVAALSRERRDHATSVLMEFAQDPRTSEYERTFYQDLAECAEMAGCPPSNYEWLDGISVTLH